jgi:hypothetical protein
MLLWIPNGCCEGVGCRADSIQWRAVVSTVMNYRVARTAGICSTRYHRLTTSSTVPTLDDISGTSDRQVEWHAAALTIQTSHETSAELRVFIHWLTLSEKCFISTRRNLNLYAVIWCVPIIPVSLCPHHPSEHLHVWCWLIDGPTKWVTRSSGTLTSDCLLQASSAGRHVNSFGSFQAGLTHWSRSSSKCYLRIQAVPQREHHTSPLQRSTG